MTALPRLLDLLAAHVEALREQGVDRVPFALPPSGPAPVPAQPAASTATAAPASPPPAPSRPAVSAKRMAPAPEAPKLVWLILNRMPECGDSLPAEKTRVAIVCAQNDLAPPHRDLLEKMLHSIGYALPAAAPAPLEASAGLHGKAARILCFGPAAHAAVSTLKMDLSLVRGKWQNSPAGRMIATHSPAYLENNPTGKKAVWTDLQALLKDLEIGVPDWTLRKLSGGKK